MSIKYVYSLSGTSICYFFWLILAFSCSLTFVTGKHSISREICYLKPSVEQGGEREELVTNKATEPKVCCTDKVYPVKLFIKKPWILSRTDIHLSNSLKA